MVDSGPWLFSPAWKVGHDPSAPLLHFWRSEFRQGLRGFPASPFSWMVRPMEPLGLGGRHPQLWWHFGEITQLRELALGCTDPIANASASPRLPDASPHPAPRGSHHTLARVLLSSSSMPSTRSVCWPGPRALPQAWHQGHPLPWGMEGKAGLTCSWEELDQAQGEGPGCARRGAF